jgi:hypothetical protein
MEQTLSAGTALMDITPPKGVELAGYPHFPRHNTGVHDPLYASCLYLESAETALAVVGLDLLFFSRKHVLEVRRALAEKTDLPPENILFCCSHSHSTPWAAGRLDREALLGGAGQDAAYLAEVKTKLVYLVAAAQRTAFPCQLGFGTAQCGPELGIGGNRRDPHGPSDPLVYTLAVKDLRGVTRCLVVNYALHPTLLHEENTLCSADYPGFIRERLGELYPAAVTVFCLGPAGDQSSRYFRQGQSFEEARRFGRAIGGAAALAADGAAYAGNLPLRTRSTPFNPPLRTLPPYAEALARVEENRNRYEALRRQGAPYLEVQNANLALLGAEDILGYIELARRGEPLALAQEELPGEVAAFFLGDLALLGLPGEIFMGVAQDIRQRAASRKLLIATVTNGCLPGYLYSAQDAALGGYEVDTSLLDPAAAQALEAAALKSLGV